MALPIAVLPSSADRSYPFEMSIPLVRSRMEESNNFARIRISSGYIRTFVAIAVQAGEGEILKNR